MQVITTTEWIPLFFNQGGVAALTKGLLSSDSIVLIFVAETPSSRLAGRRTRNKAYMKVLQKMLKASTEKVHQTVQIRGCRGGFVSQFDTSLVKANCSKLSDCYLCYAEAKPSQSIIPNRCSIFGLLFLSYNFLSGEYQIVDTTERCLLCLPRAPQAH